MKRVPNLQFSVSATTRPPRHYEKDGFDYHFLTKEAFQECIEDNQLIEWEEVYEGTYYGTLKSEVNRVWESGNHVVFDVDVVGGVNIKKQLGDKATSIFVKVSSPEILRERLMKRETETEKTLENRVKKSFEEMKFESQFDQSVLNEDLGIAVDQTEKIVNDFLRN